MFHTCIAMPLDSVFTVIMHHGIVECSKINEMVKHSENTQHVHASVVYLKCQYIYVHVQLKIQLYRPTHN